MAAKCALLSADPTVMKIIQMALLSLKMDVEVLKDFDAAAARLATSRFDAVVLDLDFDEQVSGLIAKLRTDELNRTSISITLSASREANLAGFKNGANFVLDKPLKSENVSRTMRAAYALIQRNLNLAPLQ